MKTRQFIVLLAINIIGFGLVIAIVEGTNSFMLYIPKIYDNTINKEDINQIKKDTEMIQMKVNLIQKMIENDRL